MDPQEFLSPLFHKLEAISDPDNAVSMQRYMKDIAPYYGIKSPERRAVAQQFFSTKPKLDMDETIALCKFLWNEPKRELQYIAMDLLGRKKNQLREQDIEFIEWLLLHKSWWDTVDFIATNLSGTWMKKHPQFMEQKFKEWNGHSNMWINRTAILFQLKFKEHTNVDMLIRSVENHMESTEFFIRKAIGWALREHSRRDPEFVMQFVESHPQLSNLSKREALRLISMK